MLAYFIIFIDAVIDVGIMISVVIKEALLKAQALAGNNLKQ